MTSNYKVGIYLRLSKEDGNNLESNSISKINNYDIEKLLKINKNLLSSLVDYILIIRKII